MFHIFGIFFHHVVTCDFILIGFNTNPANGIIGSEVIKLGVGKI
jgi:hypothetical protein